MGGDVLVYSETKKEWIKTLTVIGVEATMITVKDKNNKWRKTFNSFQVKSFYEKFTQNFHLCGSSKSTGTQLKSEYLFKVIMTHETKHKIFTDKINKEIIGLSQQSARKFIFAKEVPKNVTILGGRFVSTIKGEGKSNEIWKAQFVFRGHKDSM